MIFIPKKPYNSNKNINKYLTALATTPFNIYLFNSIRCGCEAGFKLNPNNRTCDDIDECEVHKSYRLCVGLCDNIPGSYRCACPEGYRIGADSRSCEGN